MGIKFLQNIDAERNKFEEAGFEMVTSLPTTNLFVGRQVMYNGKLYVYNGSQWVNVNTPYEANLLWGGRNISNGYSPIDAAMVGELSANLMAFPNPTGITVEYSRDGGVTWLDYEAQDYEKINLFTLEYGLYCGKSGPDNLVANVDYMLRITINPMECGLYAELNKAIIRISRDNGLSCWCTISALTQTDYNLGNMSDDFYKIFANKVYISGWPGYNVLNFGRLDTSNTTANSTTKHRLVRFTFGYDDVDSNPNFNGLNILSIKLFGIGRYKMPSNLAMTNHLYRYDSLQNALFPAKVESKEVINFDVNNIEPTQTGNVTKTSTWLWQYYAQSIAWIMANHLPLAGGTMTGNITVPKLIKTGGTATQMLMADGSTKDVSEFASSEDIPTQLPNPNPIIIKTADGVSVRYDGSTSGEVTLEAGDNAEVTATQDSDDTMTVKFGAVVPQTLPNPNALNITVLDSERALLGPSMVYDGVAAKYFKLIEGYGIRLSNSNLSNSNSHEVTINLKQIAGTTLLGNANGTTDIPQAITMAQLRTMLGSLMLNDISITLGGNSSYTLPCYIDYADTRYLCRISSDATGLQIYRNGVWVTIGKFCQCNTRGTITNSNIDSWYEDTVSNYELDESLSAALFAEDLTTNFGTSMAGAWTGKTVTLNLTSVSIKDTKSAWEMLKKNMGDCFPHDSVEKIRYYYNVAIPSGEVVTKIELSYNKGVGMCTVHFYTEG